MTKVTQKQIDAARRMDVQTYLECYEPHELVKISADTYCTREHDSLKISNGKWYWFSRRIGGKSALDYLVAVKGMSFVDAVLKMCEISASHDFSEKPVIEAKERKLVLPETEPCDEVKRYLLQRGIHRDIIAYCIGEKLLFQTIKHKNAMFVGYDAQKNPRYASLRGTKSGYKSEASGSDKRYAFSIAANGETDAVHVFESAIDLLSFATLQMHRFENWRGQDLLSLGGVSLVTQDAKLPRALYSYLQRHPKVKKVHLHLDNDAPGIAAASAIKQLLEDYTVIDEAPIEEKDVNDELQAFLQRMKEKGENVL